MSKITLGLCGKKRAELDIDLLLRTRLLIQANSGGGKSWLIRRLAEELFGKVQVIILDREGEFATLREKFGYVLVGKGGETPADTRSAALVARRLLEVRASAVCDLFEMKDSERHRWVRLFLDALLDAPKNLWHPLVVVADEAHTFCPEKGAGESEASDAMIGLATRGRKRGYCAVFATQRLGKLRKDAAAELLNILVGMTFIDVDRKRAADALGVPKSEQKKFFDDVKVMEHGNFFGLGRAISKERIRIKIGNVKTTHPEPGSTTHAAAPPPTPDKVRKLLPKLADLPKEAEEKAKSEAELRKEVRSLKAQLRAQPEAKPSPKTKTKVEKVDVPIITDRQVKALEKQIDRMLTSADGLTNKAVMLRKLSEAIEKALTLAKGAQRTATATLVKKMDEAKFGPITKEKSLFTRPTPKPEMATGDNGSDLTQPQKNIIRALAEFDAIGRTLVPRTWVAARSGASHKSSAFGNNLGALRKQFGFIEYGEGKTISLTTAGRQCISMPPAPMTNEEMRESCLKLLSAPQAAILRVVYAVHPESIARDSVAERAGASATSSAFGNNLGSLRSAGMIEYGPEKTVKCSDWLFVEE